ncbi:hypothetical protein B0H19DRAFT_1251167 [Mycena capillaripes]|nr:hypothetical protein B0H19DRAFT_1251167 [Mycena capillaripes]
MINLTDPLVQLKITSATCSFCALGTTLYRLYQRRGRFWADDICALVAFVTLIIQVIAVFLHIPVPNNLSKTTRIATYYLSGTTFYIIIWASRLSILFSIIRIDPSAERRKRLLWVAVAFVMASLFLLAQLVWVCESEPLWKKKQNPQCSLPAQVGLCQLVTDVIADLILLFAPWPLFRNLFDKSLRYKLTIIFSTCVVTTVVSLVHAAYILKRGHIRVLISAVTEDCVSLIVANIPVVVTTMVDIVGEGDQVGTSQTARFTSMFWFSEAETTAGAMELQAITEESPEARLAYAKSTPDTSDLPVSERSVVDSIRSMKPVYLHPRSYDTRVHV